MKKEFLQISNIVIDCHHAAMRQTPLSMGINAGDVIAVVGPQNGGKTTLMQTIAQLIQPKQGRITLQTVRPVLCQHAVYLNEATSLVSSLNILDNLLLPALYHQVTTRNLLEQKAQKLLMSFDRNIRPMVLPPYLKPESQRVACLVRSLLMEPDIICLDEMFKGLHHTVIHRVATTLLKYVEDHQRSLVIGTQNISFVKTHATSIIFVSSRGLQYFPHSQDFFASGDTHIQDFINHLNQVHHV